MRKKLIVGNYKMNYTINQAEDFIESIKETINTPYVDVVICPNFVALDRVYDILYGTNIKLGAQNVHYEEKGAYTGETSIDMLISAGVEYVIVGHSERREMFFETDENVNKKVHTIINKDLKPIICVGETLEIREKNEHFDYVKNQVIKAIDGVNEEQVKRNIIIAYEPIWAIGTGKTATKNEAEEMCKYIRETITSMYNEKVAESVKILYGGSVKSSNAHEIIESENIDGALVGGASLTNEFTAIVNY